MSDEGGVEKIDLEKVDWRGSREFFESLGDALDKLDDHDESYDFTWVGKRKSIIEAGAPINKTLRPDVENSKNWDTTENLFIEGDNLDALKLLQESYLGKVKMIYIDPPYNTGKDFVYHDNFKADVEQYDEDTEYKDDEGNIQFKKNEKSNGRYHSDWLSMMYPRLKLARNLLSDDGVIFISIDDNEQANLKKLCDEVFGEDNLLSIMKFKVRHEDRQLNARATFQKTTEFCLVYAKDVQSNPIDKKKVEYTYNDYNTKISVLSAGEERKIGNKTVFVYKPGEYKIESCDDISDTGIVKSISIRGTIKTGQNSGKYYENYLRPLLAQDGEDCLYKVMDMGDDGIGFRYIKQPNSKTINGVYYQGIPTNVRDNIDNAQKEKAWSDSFDFVEINNRAGAEIRDLLGGTYFDTPKPVKIIEFLASLISDKGAYVVDFFSGSATTAHAVMQLNAEDGGNRKWIMVQLPEETDEKSEAFKAGYKTIPEISRERIRRAGDKIASEHPDAAVDYGFRALRIDDTNHKDVYRPAADYQQNLLDELVDNIKPDRSDLDLLYGVLTATAWELNKPLETVELDGATVYKYDYFGEVSGLIACFADEISEDTIKQIAQLKPLTAVFREDSFPNSQAKVNLAEHFRIISPDTKVKVI